MSVVLLSAYDCKAGPRYYVVEWCLQFPRLKRTTDSTFSSYNHLVRTRSGSSSSSSWLRKSQPS